MRNSIKSFAVVSTVALSAGLMACGGGSSSTDTIPANADVVVKATNSISFDKDTYTANAGDIGVAYQNESSLRHTLLVVKDGDKVSGFKLIINKKGDVDSGQVTLKAGEYTLICDVPGHSNMKAKFTVK